MNPRDPIRPPLQDPAITRIFACVQVADPDESIAIAGGRISAELSKTGNTIEFNDGLIAATILTPGMDRVITRNCDHFSQIGGCRAITPEELTV